MTHTEIVERLDDYVDGALDAADRDDVRRHLEGCDPCRGEEEALRALLVEAAGLPRGIAPPRDLWEEIAPRLEPKGGAPVIPLFRGGPGSSRWLLAAAAVLLVAVSSTVTAVVMRRTQDTVAFVPSTGTTAPAPAALASFQPAERAFGAAIDELAAALEQRRATLSPTTVETLERNLKIVDDAIRESKAALAADPNNPELARMLSSVYETKVEMLQQAVQL